MGFINACPDTLANAIKRGDKHFRFTAAVSDADPLAASLTLPSQTQAIYVGSDSDIDKFSLVYRDPADDQSNIVDYISPGCPWINRIGIGVLNDVDVANARPYEASFGGSLPKVELIVLLQQPSTAIAILRPPSIQEGIFAVAGAGETLVLRIYCYGRKTFSLQMQTGATAPAITVRVEGATMAATGLGLPNIAQTLGSQTIAAAGGTVDIQGSCAGYDRLNVFATGPIVVGEGFQHLEVRD